MRPYHCYFLNARGRIVDRRVLMCADDREAAEQLPDLLAERPEFQGVEVWERSRRIALQGPDPRMV